MEPYKLKSEIREFIIQKAREHPELGCRKLSGLIEQAFKLDISKSTIGTVLKSEGLNKPAGRRQAKKEDGLATLLTYEVDRGKARNKETLLLSTDRQSELLIPAPEVSGQSIGKIIGPSLPANEGVSQSPERSEGEVIPEWSLRGAEGDEAISAGMSPLTEALPPVAAEQKATEPEPVVHNTALPNMGCWFLKAAELSLGGAQAISDILSSIKPEGNGLPSDRQSHNKDERKPADFLPLTESLLYLALFGAQEYKDLGPLSKDALSLLSGKKCSAENLQWRLDYLELTQPVILEIFNRLVALARGVLAIKFILEDSSFFFLDAGGHSIWSTGGIPKYFSSGLEKTKGWLNEVMAEIKPLILQAPPGFAKPAPAFLDFLDSFQGEKPDKAIKRIELYSPDNLLIETIKPPPQKKRYFILGLWPWQCQERRAELTFRTIGYKKDNHEILTIMTNFTEGQQASDKVIADYLERWPNLEIGYQDFLDKIGHFHQRLQIDCRQKNNVQFPEADGLTLSGILAYWRQELNFYCQAYFFPPSCREWDFLLLKERFYNLRAKVDSETALLKVVFELPGDFAYLQDLSYACQRVNEADIHLIDGRKLVFEPGAIE